MKYQVIFESGRILSVSLYVEGNAIYMPSGKGILIHDSITVLKLMLASYGVTDFSQLNNFS